MLDHQGLHVWKRLGVKSDMATNMSDRSYQREECVYKVKGVLEDYNYPGNKLSVVGLAGGIKAQEVVGTISTDEDLLSCFETGRRCEIF